MKRLLKRFGRALAGPLPRYFDRRFAGVHEHLDAAGANTDRLRADLDGRLAALDTRIDKLQQRLDGEILPLEELVTALEREVGRLRQGLEPSR